MAGARVWLERDNVTAAASDLLDIVASGGSGALFVLGEAGLGKTSLVEQVCERASGRVRVGLGRGHPMDTALAFGLAKQALDGIDGGAGVLLTNPASMEHVRATQLHGVLRWLARPDGWPLLLVFDDLHWADADSLLLVSFLCRRLAGLPVGVLAASRPWPSAAPDMVRELAHDGYGVVMPLEPLSRGAAGTLLVRRAEKALPGEIVERACRLCGGNPLLLEQMAAVINEGEDVPNPLSDGSPVSSVEVVLSRFAGLPAAGLRLARAASVLGPSFLPGLAVEIAQLAEEEVDQALEAVGRSGLMRPAAGGGTEFVHPLFAQALYRDLGGPLRTRLHARAFAALIGRGREVEAAEHAVRAELVGDPVAVEVLQRVGLAARRAGAVTSAAERLQAAVALAGDRAQNDLLLAAGQVLIEAGRLGEAVAVHERIIDRPDCPIPMRIEALHSQGRALTYTGNYGRAETCLRKASRLAEVTDPAKAVEVLLDHAMSFWTRTGPGAALPLITQARAIATEAMDVVPGRVHAAWSSIALQCGHPPPPGEIEAAIAELDAQLGADITDLGGVFGMLYNVATVAFLTERFAYAERLFGVGCKMGEKQGAVVSVVTFRGMHARTLFTLGRVDEAMHVLDLALRDADVVPTFEFYSCVGAACTSHYQGRREQSQAWGDRVELLAPGQDLVLLYVRELDAQRHLRDGSAEQASGAYLRIEATTQRIGIGEPCLVYCARHAVAAHLGCGRTTDAERVVAWLAERSAVLPCRWPRIALASSQAALAEADGDHSRAEDHLREALAHHNHVELPVEKIETLLGYGSFLRRVGQPARARPLLTEALDLVESTGARWYAPPLREELSLAGGRRRRSAEDPGRLTPAEARVARHVAAGRSNRQVAAQLSLSVHTVEGHLDKIYTKLGIHSRGELIAAVHDEGGKGQGIFPI